MLKLAAASLFSVLFCNQPLLAGQNEVELKYLSNQRKEVVAGITSNFLVQVVNNSNEYREVELRVSKEKFFFRQIPEIAVTGIEAKGVSNKILSVFIPGNSRSGDYDIIVESFLRGEDHPIGSVTIPLFVIPKYGISVQKQYSPEFIVSGDTLGLKFFITNFSNMEVSVNASISSSNKTETRFYKIPMDSSVNVSFTVKAPENLSFQSRNFVSLTASVNEKPETEVSESYLIDFLPGRNVKFDRFNRYPVKLAALAVATNRRGSFEYAYMYDVSGDGFLNEEKRRKLEFHFRGPDRRGNPLLGLNEEYFFNYSSPKTQLSLGDNNYRLSDLTESSRYGRGGEIAQKLGKLSVGAYFHMPRYYPQIKYVTSFYLDLNFGSAARFKTGYVGKFDKDSNIDHLVSLYGQVNPFSWFRSEFEVAAGKSQESITKAYKANFNISTSFISSHFSYLHADPDFTGFLKNSSFLTSGLTINLFKKLSLSGNYDINRINLSLDTIYVNAPYSENMGVNLTLRMGMNSSFLLGAQMISMEDRAETKLFNYKKYAARFVISTRLKRTSISLNGEAGKSQNLLELKEGELTDYYNGNLSLKFALNKSLSISGFLNYQGGEQYLINGFQRVYFGGSIQANIRQKTFFSLDYRNNYELKDYYQDRSLFSMSLSQRIGNRHELNLGVNYNLMKNSLDKKELNAQLKYTLTINVPTSRKKEFGKLKGKILNSGLETVKGVVVNLNGNIAITDKEGNFEFPAIKTGSYIMAIEAGAAGLNAIPATPGPFKITIEPGRETTFEVMLTKSAKIHGSLVIREDEKSGQKGFYPVKHEVENLIVEASSEKEVFRILTGAGGKFSFNDLRPGTWNIRVYKNGLPPGYMMENDRFSLNLTPGLESSLEVVLIKKSREIKFQSSFK